MGAFFLPGLWIRGLEIKIHLIRIDGQLQWVHVDPLYPEPKKSKHIVYFDQLDGQRRDYVELELDQETPFICMKGCGDQHFVMIYP